MRNKITIYGLVFLMTIHNIIIYHVQITFEIWGGYLNALALNSPPICTYSYYTIIVLKFD